MTTSHFELQLQNTDPKTLVQMMVGQLHAINKKDADCMQLKTMFSYSFDALVHKLSCANEQDINEINNLLSDKNNAHTFIKNALTQFYKKNYETLEQAANELASLVHVERKELLQEAGEHDERDRYDTSGAINNFKYYKAENILDGTAPQIEHFFNDSKTQAIRNHSIGDALHYFWQNLNKNEIKLHIKSESSSEDEDVNFKKAETTNIGMSLPKENWIQYKNNIHQGINALSDQKASILFQDSSPIASFFKDMVNSVCEQLGISAPFSQHKTHQNFKETIQGVRRHFDLEDTPVENKDNFKQPPR